MASPAACHQCCRVARSQAQKARAQKGASVYATAVKTVVGANSHSPAATGPPSRSKAQAASAEQTSAIPAPARCIGSPSASAARSSNGRPGKKARSIGSA